MTEPQAEPLIEARNLVKTFGRVRALRGANFSVFPGEVVALIGDNGAGKSVLTKCLSGVLQPDGGEILIGGVPVKLDSPLAAMRHGIETVYQDLALADDLEASANLFLGREIFRGGVLGRFGVLARKEMRERARTAFKDLGVELQDVRAPIASLVKWTLPAIEVRSGEDGMPDERIGVWDSSDEDVEPPPGPDAEGCKAQDERPVGTADKIATGSVFLFSRRNTAPGEGCARRRQVSRLRT